MTWVRSELGSDRPASAAHCVLRTEALGVQQYKMTLWNQLLSLHTWGKEAKFRRILQRGIWYFTVAALMTRVSFTVTQLNAFMEQTLTLIPSCCCCSGHWGILSNSGFVPPLHRTLITGMVSGSIVAFNIDFNRWHYEHQNRYWAEEHQTNALSMLEGWKTSMVPSLGVFFFP